MYHFIIGFLIVIFSSFLFSFSWYFCIVYFLNLHCNISTNVLLISLHILMFNYVFLVFCCFPGNAHIYSWLIKVYMEISTVKTSKTLDYCNCFISFSLIFFCFILGCYICISNIIRSALIIYNILYILYIPIKLFLLLKINIYIYPHIFYSSYFLSESHWLLCRENSP